MQHDPLDLRLDPVPAANRIIRLRPRDAGLIDPAPVAALYAIHGPAVAEEMVCATYQKLTRHEAQIAVLIAAGRHWDIPDVARKIVLAADDLGLTEVCLAAAHVMDTATAGHAIALAATTARLRRLIDHALEDLAEAQGGP